MTTTMRVTHKALMPTDLDMILVTLQQENGPSIGQPIISILVSSKRSAEFPLGGTVIFTHEEMAPVKKPTRPKPEPVSANPVSDAREQAADQNDVKSTASGDTTPPGEVGREVKTPPFSKRAGKK